MRSSSPSKKGPPKENRKNNSNGHFFLFCRFQTNDTSDGAFRFFYLDQIDAMAGEERDTIFVEYEHLINFDDGTLADEIQSSYYRFLPPHTSPDPPF